VIHLKVLRETLAILRLETQVLLVPHLKEIKVLEVVLHHLELLDLLDLKDLRVDQVILD
jgi:hypothetical protein